MTDSIIFVLLSIAIIGMFVLVYGRPRKKEGGEWIKRTLSPTFARVYGLISIAVLAVAAVRLTADAAVLTGVFTLFGTIAGYLAGSRVEVSPPASADGNAEAPTLELG